MDYKVGLSDLARADLKAIALFLAEAHGAEAALRLGDELLDTALSLAILPRRGPPVRRRPGMRKLSHRHWLIFYQINEAARWVEVVRIWDGRQNPAALHLP
jgi:plasmid stabilization system protein ParE